MPQLHEKRSDTDAAISADMDPADYTSRERVTRQRHWEEAMIGTLLSVILLLVVLGVILWAVQQLLPLVPMPPPFLKVIQVLITVIIVLVVVYAIAGLLGVVTPMRF